MTLNSLKSLIPFFDSRNSLTYAPSFGLDDLRKKHGIDVILKSLYSARGLTVNDYFMAKLHKPYEYNRKGYNSNSKYFER